VEDVSKEYFIHESITVYTEALRKMQSHSAQRQSIYHLRKSKTQATTGIVNHGEN
jgi:hypothetical protein